MITSKSNEFVKFVKSLYQKKYRDEYGKYIVEGVKLVQEAIAEKMLIDKIIISESFLNEELDILDIEMECVSDSVFQFLSDTQSPQGIMAIVQKKISNEPLGNTIFALDNIQDPGNLGTIIRTLDCAGIDTLFLSKGTVDLYNPKVVRGTMGAIYRMNVIENVDLSTELTKLKNNGYHIIITDLSATIFHYNINFSEKNIIVIGNEANGVSDEIKSIADLKVKIPMLRKNGKLECWRGCKYHSI